MRRPNVYSIPAGVPFLPTLIDALFAGRFGAVDAGDPLALADVTILLPTRRSARALRQILIERNPARAALLPRIRPIGDVDEEEHLLAPAEEDPGDTLKLPPAISRLQRSLILSRLILAWGNALRAADPALSPEQQTIAPSSAADAFKLAGDLARLIDDMETAGIGWERLAELAPDDYAIYWRLTLDFLKIAGEQWPRHLQESERADPAQRRDRLIRDHARRLATFPPTGPVIAAGSTGSIPATAELLRTIASLPNGAVVLPGLDQGLDNAGWKAIGGDASETPSHPQSGLKRLIETIGIVRDDVKPLGAATPTLTNRARLASEMMRPAATTEEWVHAGELAEGALDGIETLVARNEEEEALAIAIALREALEQPEGIAALVTPDRNLAGRVSVAMRRWGIAVDDSAGQPLGTTPAGILARLLAEAALGDDTHALAAIGKHPLARFHMGRRSCRIAAEALEAAILRGPSSAGRIADLAKRLTDIRFRTEMKADRFPPRARRRLTKREWNEAETLARRMAAVLGPLEALVDTPTISVGQATELLATALEAAAEDGQGNGLAVWDERAGEALAELLTGLSESTDLRLPPREYPSFLASAMAGIAIAPEPGPDPRIHIWGTLEARLQPADLMILGGLDEGVWPVEARTDAWLSRQMRATLGLPPPERRIGLAAHDFVSGFTGAERVILSRAERRGGTPTVASRWLQRLKAVAGDSEKAARDRGERYLDLARRLDRVAQSDVSPALRPSPTPKLEARPRELSVTSIETLIRDPYAVYARRILQLEPLDPIGQRADPRARGMLIHEAFADFTKEWQGSFDRDARQRLLQIWEKHFEEISAYPEVHAVWLLKADRIAEWMIGWEAGRDDTVAERQAEIPGRLSFDSPGGAFTLTARADRIDSLKDGRTAIYDYKTGMVATPKQVLLFQPQLALEGAILRAGGFGDGYKDKSIAELAWIGLGLIGKGEPLRAAVPDDMTPDSVSDAALTRLKELIAAYDDPARGYISQARPMFERRFGGDYDHLARVAEWRYAAPTSE